MRMRTTPVHRESWTRNLKYIAFFAGDGVPKNVLFLSASACRGALCAWYGGHWRALLALLRQLVYEKRVLFVASVRLAWLSRVRGYSGDECIEKMFGSDADGAGAHETEAKHGK